MLVTILFASLVCSAQRIVLSGETVNLPQPFGALYLYRLVPPFPVNGTIYSLGAPLEYPYAFDELTDISYEIHDVDVFQTSSSDPPPYDIIIIEVTLLNGETNDVANFTTNVTVWDDPLLISENTTVLIGTNSTTLFSLTIDTRKDKYGISDGIPSMYAFRDPSNASHIYHGITFNSSCGESGCLFESDCTTLIQPSIEYKSLDFCANFTSIGTSAIEYYAIGRNGSVVGDAGVVTLASFLVVPLCVECHVTIPETTSTRLNDSIFSFTSDGVTTVYLRPVSLPDNVMVVINNQTAILDELVAFPIVSIDLVPRLGFFNQFIFSNGSLSSNYSDGSPIFERCFSGVCEEIFSFSINSMPTQTLYITVQRYVLTDTLYACSLCTISNEYAPGGFGFVLPASDGQLQPDYMVTLTSLPSHGILYNGGVAMSSNNTIFSGRTADLYYEPIDGYYNRIFYASSPNVTITETNEYGELVSGTPDVFTFSIHSNRFPELEPQHGTIEVLVSAYNTTQLTACPEEANETNPWGQTCVSFGLESNTIYGEYATPILLEIGGSLTDDELSSLVYRILRYPTHGLLYINTGTMEDPVFGARLLVLDEATTPYLVYVGNTNYANQRSASSSNVIGEPMGGCEYVFEQGCPDTFQFDVRVSNSSRRSQTATYQVYIVALSSEITMTFPETLHVDKGEVKIPITYSDPDDGEAYVLIQIVSYDLYFGAQVAVELLPPCMEIFNCTEEVNIYVPDKYAKQVIENITVRVEENSTAEDENTIFVNVIKRPEIGFTPSELYVPSDTDIVYAMDVIVFADPTDGDPYYFDGCEMDDCEEFFASQNAITAASESNYMVIIAVAASATLWALLLILLCWALWCRETRKHSKVDTTSATTRKASKSTSSRSTLLKPVRAKTVLSQ